MLEHVFYLVAIMGLFNAAVYWTLEKWGVIKFMQLHIREWVWPSSCQLCFFHRCALVEVIALFIFFYQLEHAATIGIFLIIVPMAAAAFSVWVIK